MSSDPDKQGPEPDPAVEPKGGSVEVRLGPLFQDDKSRRVFYAHRLKYAVTKILTDADIQSPALLEFRVASMASKIASKLNSPPRPEVFANLLVKVLARRDHTGEVRVCPHIFDCSPDSPHLAFLAGCDDALLDCIRSALARIRRVHMGRSWTKAMDALGSIPQMSEDSCERKLVEDLAKAIMGLLCEFDAVAAPLRKILKDYPV